LLIAFSALGATPAGNLLVAEAVLRAGDSDLHWQVRDGTHPKMGPIKVAISAEAHTSYIGTSRIVSATYLSCEKKTGKIAIELTNARNTEMSSGLKLKESPGLTCLGVAGPGALPPRSEIAASWEANELGDVLTRGLSPSALRACVAIEVREKILLPPAIGRDVEEVTFEIPTYAPGPDAVFSACGEPTAYGAPENVAQQVPTPAPSPAKVAAATVPAAVPAPSPPAVAAPAPAAKAPPPAPVATTKAAPPAPTPSPAPAQIPPQPAAPAGWQRAHTLAKGRSNIRKAPSLSSPVVAELPPGVRILVMPTSNEWWHVKSPSGATYEGYIRNDRFTLD
jgi:hypothetical protein